MLQDLIAVRVLTQSPELELSPGSDETRGTNYFQSGECTLAISLHSSGLPSWGLTGLLNVGEQRWSDYDIIKRFNNFNTVGYISYLSRIHLTVC